MPKFSVQICCYNSERYLDETIRSVICQTFKDWEMVIVNDGSTDATESIVRRYIDEGVPITYFWQENRGFAAARNKAIELSRARWIAILDHDDVWCPGKLKAQSEAIDRHPEAKLHFANSEWFLDSGRTVRTTVEDNRFESGILENAFTRLLTEGCFIDSETAVMDKHSIIECGGFNERYAYIVDYDAFIKMARSNAVCYENAVLARWRMHKRQASSVMKATMFEEYVLMFEDIINSYDLPGDVRRIIKDEITSNLVKYSALGLGEGKIRKSLSFAIKRLDPYSMARFAAIKAPRAAYRKIKSITRRKGEK
ncbi:MAG TPA: glycosyltransferase family 2 protein [Candidatus Omnitrophota bacterium]|nr:glycosyltransferase family 2 protein [Candidatus Omnitrophota bacterium]